MQITGVRFHALLKLIAGRYPALRLDINPGPLSRGLDAGIRYQQLYLVGIDLEQIEFIECDRSDEILNSTTLVIAFRFPFQC